MKQCVENSNPTWEAAKDKVENTIERRFIRINSGYLSILETSVVDFARFVFEKGSGSSSVDDFWKNLGFPITPLSPVVGIKKTVANTFCGWLA